MPTTKTTSHTGPKDIFFHFLSIILLYLSAVHVGLLLYQFINIYFPDSLTDYYVDPSQYYGPLRWALATLAVVFPVYIWTRHFLAQDYQENPEKRELKTRKWLVYFTLFGTALVIIGDLVAVLNRFLEGELTARFGLKVLTILLIAASVFLYYYWDLKEKTRASATTKAWFNKTIIALVTVAVLSGFWVAGSPQSQRLRRFDQRKVSDLQNLQYQIVEYWRTKKVLPQDLSQLNDTISGYTPPVDPQTKQPYQYRVLDELQFELCAEFQTESSAPSQPEKAYPSESGFQDTNWQHKAGNQCFKRTIDPDKYGDTIKPRPAPGI